MVLLIVTAFIYGQTLDFGFVHDDLTFASTWLQPFSWELVSWRRLFVSLSHALGYAISGVEAWGHHLVSVALHLLNGGLLWAVMGGTWAAVFALGLFLLHPLQIESVAYVSARSDLLLVTVTLLAVLAVERRQVALALVIALAGVLVKEAGVAIVPLIGFWIWSRRLADGLFLYWLVGCSALVLIPVALVVTLTLDPSYTATELTKVWVYVALLAVPYDVSIEMPWAWIAPPIAWFCTATALLMVAGALTVPRSRFALAILWTLIALSPRLLIPLVEGLHAHHLAVPFVGLALAVGARSESESWLV